MTVVSHEVSILIDMDQTIRQQLINFEVYCLHYYAVAKLNNDDHSHPNSSLIPMIITTPMLFLPHDQLESMYRQMWEWVHHPHHQNLGYHP